MKKLLPVMFIALSATAFSQTSTNGQPTPVNNTSEQRSAATSVRNEVSPTRSLPYDVNDEYMGRKSEFLNQMIVSELPADFPKYEKQWGIKEYNAVVDAYYINHPEILKDKFKEKIKYIQSSK